MSKSFLAVLGAIAGLGLATVTQAKSQLVAVGNLEPAMSGGTRAMTAQKLILSADKPAGLVKEPHYKFTPKYGTVTLGNAKNNKIIVVLDTDGETTRPSLYVDANGNGDLTDDAPVMLMVAKPASANGAKTVSVTNTAGDATQGWSAIVPVVAHYDIPGRAGSVPSGLAFTVNGAEVTYNREYARTGVLTVGSRSYRMALVDQGVNGKFNEFQHEEGDPARVTVMIDRNGNGKFEDKEMFDAAKPFRMAGATYEVISIDARGTAITLKKSGKSGGNALTAADMKAGSDVLDFEVETLDGKTVSFPDDYKGKVVLLDFWATWCGPCMMEMPNVVATYNQYHSQGFEILGISLDHANLKKQSLFQFLSQHSMPWQQVYDGGWWKAEIAQLFDVHAIPFGIVVDGTSGKIISVIKAESPTRSEDLRQAVEAGLSKGK